MAEIALVTLVTDTNKNDMKTTLLSLLFALFVFASVETNAQGTLQFNQVLNVELNGSTPFTFTVPANKVWKIESVGTGYHSSSIYLRNTSNEVLAYLYYNSPDNRVKLPYWLGSNFSGNIYRVGNLGSGNKASLSIIEFNVVP